MKLKTSWDLSLLYRSDTDPHIERDVKGIERACAVFARSYKDKPFTASPKALATALDDLEELRRTISGSKPWWYFALKSDLNSANAVANARTTQYEQRLTDATNAIAFFELEIAKISSTEQARFLKHPALKPYAYALQRMFETAQYNLSEGEEQLSNLLSQTGYTMWIDAQERLLNQQTIEHKGKDIPIAEALGTLPDLPRKERQVVHEKISTVLKGISHLAEAEVNAVYNFKKIMDTRRGFKQPYSATILSYENTESAVISFVEFVTKHFTISQRFYALHAKLLKQKRITMADRSVKIGDMSTTFDFASAVDLVRSAFNELDPQYGAILDRFLEKGQIDVHPKKGKRGGAYCWGMGELPTFVLLNHVDDVRSLETLAHEMGHAIHTELSKAQPPRYQHYSTATAEVASTFFEQLASRALEPRLSKKEQIVLLHNRIQGDIASIFRQIACFNFERDLHAKIRAEGQVSKEAIAQLLRKHLESYVGSAVEVTEDDGYFFVTWSHIRRFFYVYTYAYGQLISRTLYERWCEDRSYAGKIEQFLKAGKSQSPEAIFKSIGINITDPKFYGAGLKSIERDIDRLEQLTGH